MVAREWVEGPELHPPHAQVGSGVAVEATDVCPHHWYSKEVEVEDP